MNICLPRPAVRLNAGTGDLVMTISIQRAFVVVPLGLILAGCSHSTKSTQTTASSEKKDVIVVTDDRHPQTPVDLASHQEMTPAPSTPAPSTHASSGYPSVDFNELSAHVRNKSAVIVDARSSLSFAGGHVRGAINIPVEQKESSTEQYLRHLNPDQLIIIYCGGSTCHTSEMLYEYLLTQGFTNMRIFVPGWQRLASANDLR
jgi:rhodanese-related sulfurtransferase